MHPEPDSSQLLVPRMVGGGEGEVQRGGDELLTGITHKCSSLSVISISASPPRLNLVVN
jgi:hypothetical protein